MAAYLVLPQRCQEELGLPPQQKTKGSAVMLGSRREPARFPLQVQRAQTGRKASDTVQSLFQMVKREIFYRLERKERSNFHCSLTPFQTVKR